VKPWLRRLSAALAGLCLLALVMDRLWPPPLPQASAYTRVVSDSQGNPLRTFPAADGILRYRIDLDQVSPRYLQALLGFEDRWFYWHPGVNPFALLRATGQWLANGRIISGGSTLSMQVARILEPRSRNLTGKLQQMLRALQLEWRLSKQQILGIYINHAPFGGNLEGVEAAARAYLHKPALELSHAEAALLAALPQSPSRLRPDRWPQRARIARDKVLQRLADQAIWTAETVTDARREQVYGERPQQPLQAPLLARRLLNHYPGERLNALIDSDLQQGVRDLVLDHIQAFPQPVTAAALVMRNADGALLAYLGNADFANPRRAGYVDLARALRSPGSTLKPLLFGLAIDEGLIHSQSLLADVPRLAGDYRPDNFQQGFNGPVTASRALQRSLNLPAVQLLEHYGPRRFAAKLRNAGLNLHIPGDGRPNLAVILGGTGVRLTGLVGVYSALARQGLSIQPRALVRAPQRQRRLFSAGAAWITYRTLADNPRGDFAPDHRFRQRTELAWKTGTSYGYRDAWAIGVNADYSIGVWVGRPDGTPSPGQHGSATAAPLLFRIVGLLPQSAALPRPDSVSTATICHPLGTLKSTTPTPSCHRSYQAWLLDGTAPPTLNDRLDPSGNPLRIRIDSANGLRLPPGCVAPREDRQEIALWPRQVEPWLPTGLRRSSLLPRPAPQCRIDARPLRDLQISHLADDSIYQAAGPDAAPPRIALHALGGQGPRHWYVNGRHQLVTHMDETRHLSLDKPGPVQITVIDAAGNIDQKRLYLR
jgi:penicillin-binding protein 1C